MGGGQGGGAAPVDCASLTEPGLVSTVSGQGTADHWVTDFLAIGGTVYVARQPSVATTAGWNVDGAVSRVAATGGTELPWSQVENWPTDLVLANNHLYFLDFNYGTIKRIDLVTNGAPEVIFQRFASAPSATTWALQGQTLIWANAGSSDLSTASIWRTDLNGGATSTIVDHLDAIYGFLVDADGIYFITTPPTYDSTTLWRIATGTAAALPLHTISGNQTLYGIATDTQAIYVVDRNAGALLSIDKATGAVSTAASVGNGFSFAIDGTNAYWVETVCAQMDPEGCVQTNSLLQRSALGSGSVTTLTTISGYFFPQRIRTDGSCVLWDDRRTRSIFRLGK
jgi:hypothetical protein